MKFNEKKYNINKILNLKINSIFMEQFGYKFFL